MCQPNFLNHLDTRFLKTSKQSSPRKDFDKPSTISSTGSLETLGVDCVDLYTLAWSLDLLVQQSQKSFGVGDETGGEVAM